MSSIIDKTENWFEDEDKNDENDNQKFKRAEN